MVHCITILLNPAKRQKTAQKISAIKTGFAAGLIVGIMGPYSPALAQEVAQPETTPITAAQVLKVQDKRLIAIAERMLLANSDSCPEQMLLTGMVMHSRDQYADGVDLGFSGSDIGISAVLEGGPADIAGLREDDALITINGTDLRAIRHDGEQPFRDVVFGMLTASSPDKPIQIGVMRDGQAETFSLTPPTGCRALVEILAKDALSAQSDGRVIQVSYGLASIVDDEQLAVIFAHELAHLVLKHRRRLEAAGISKGMLGELGKNQRVNRQVEVEADRLSVHLLANAGYNPQIAVNFWQTPVGKRAGGGMMRSTTYPSPSARAVILQREITQYLPLGSGPSVPGHLLARRTSQF